MMMMMIAVVVVMMMMMMMMIMMMMLTIIVLILPFTKNIPQQETGLFGACSVFWKWRLYNQQTLAAT